MGKQKSSNGDGTRLLDSDSEDEGLLQINKKYAVRFEEKERKNELQRARALGIGEDNGEEEDSEDDESEDEDAEQLSSALDLQIVRTINSIKRRDPAIYETGKVWFEKPPASDDDEDDGDGDGDVGEERASGKSSRRATYKDVIRSQLLLSGADVEGGTDVEDAKRSKKQSSLSYNTEQERLRQAFLKSARDDEDEDEDVLVVKKKSTAEQEQEESELQTALIELKTLTEKQLSKEAKRIEKKKAKAGDSSSSSSSSSSLSHQENKDKARSQGKEEQRDGGSFFSGASSFDPRVVPAEDREKFLLDYMAKKQWVMPKVRYSDREYRDSSALSLLGPHDRDVVDLDEDAEEVERMDAFESKYNFRFEEVGDAPGGLSQVVGHSRTIPGLVRREDDKRKQQRAAREEAKARERRIKEEEIKRLKNLKRQELRHRLEKIAKLGGLDLGELEAAAEEEEEPSGNAKSKSKGKGKGKGGNDKACRSKALKVNVGDLDEDWDPAAHDRLMTAQFDDSYYEQEDDGFDAGDADPELEQEVGGYAYEDEDDGQGEGEGEGAYAGGAIAKAAAAAGKGKAAAKTVKMLAQAEQEGQDELYKLDFEDIVAGIPTRFKYCSVAPDDFGLDAVEILLADDKELNKFVSLRRLSAYRDDSGLGADGAASQGRGAAGGGNTNSTSKVGSSGEDGSKLAKKRKRLRAALREALRAEEEQAAAQGLSSRGSAALQSALLGPRSSAQDEDDDEEQEENEGGEDEGGSSAAASKHHHKKQQGQQAGAGAAAGGKKKRVRKSRLPGAASSDQASTNNKNSTSTISSSSVSISSSSGGGGKPAKEKKDKKRQMREEPEPDKGRSRLSLYV